MSVNLSLSDVLLILGMFGSTTWTLLVVFSRQQKKIWDERHEAIKVTISGAKSDFDAAILKLERTTTAFESDVHRIERDLLNHKIELAEHYAKKADVETIGRIMDRRFNELGEAMRRIEDKMDKKIDHMVQSVAK